MKPLAITALLVFLLAAQPVAAQDPAEDLFAFHLSAQETVKELNIGEAVTFALVFRDLSKDSTSGLAPQSGVPNVSPQQHQVRFRYEILIENAPGWYVLTPAPMNTQGGEIRDARVTIGASVLAQSVYLPVRVTALASANGNTYESSVNLTVYTLGTASFNAQAANLGGEIKPDTIVDVELRITNGALTPRGFDIEIIENSCNMQVAASQNNFVPAKSTTTYTISLRTPNDRPWYFYQICALTVQISPSANALATRTISVPVIVNGGYLHPVWVFWFIAIVLAAILFVLFAKRRKERVEEEILGKPQKPWTIPVEVVYLKALRSKDERAWYVVRHHLMEEEYRSSLLWYAAYKAATKGTRKKETLVLRQEKSYERWTQMWQRKITQPLKDADRFEAKLQRKLDRKARKSHRKQLGKFRAVVAKMEKGHAAQVERAMAAWEKETRKATKKGLPLPKRPSMAEPDYPAEPDLEPIALSSHKWARKAARFRARAVRKQGDLEVKFEQADARHLANLRKTVQRVARKLDDPAFVAEHPLLQADP